MSNANVPVGMNRRQYERFIFRRKIKLHFFEGESYELPCLDISAGGIGIIAQFNVPADTSCRLEVTIPFENGALSFEIRAKVMHTIYRREHNGFIIGLNFIGITPYLQTMIVCLKRGKYEENNVVLDSVAKLGRHSNQ